MKKKIVRLFWGAYENNLCHVYKLFRTVHKNSLYKNNLTLFYLLYMQSLYDKCLCYKHISCLSNQDLEVRSTIQQIKSTKYLSIEKIPTNLYRKTINCFFEQEKKT